jgi:hypothetical protein
MRARTTEYSYRLGRQLAQLFAALAVVSIQLASHAADDAAMRLAQATAALSRANWTNGVAKLEAVMDAPFREVQPSDSASAADVPAELFRYTRVLKPTVSGTGIQWLFVDKTDPRDVVTSIRPDATTCVSPIFLEQVLHSKAEFISPPPLHGAPFVPSPGAFLPGTDWHIRVLHSVERIGESMPFAIASGVRVGFVIRPGNEPCVLQLNFTYGGMLLPIDTRR